MIYNKYILTITVVYNIFDMPFLGYYGPDLTDFK